MMLGAPIPDIAYEPDKALMKLQENFVLDRLEDEAVTHVQKLLDESVSATFAVVVEEIHKLAQYWRR